jgi:hypothetical protein
LLLALLGAAAKQNDRAVAILAEIDSVAGTESIFRSNTPAPTPFTFERLPAASWYSAAATFAAAGALRPSNHAP